MYLFDFFKKIIRKSNVPIIIYLIVNVFIITGTVSFLFELPIYFSFPVGIVLYFLSLLIALSPVGEWILRLQTGCKKISRMDHQERLLPLFKEVFGKARTQDCSICEDVDVYLSADKAPNAFATGRKTICVTEGMLEMPKDQIKAALGHEFGHLANKDTDLILLVSVGNLVVTAIIFGFRLLIDLAFLSIRLCIWFFNLTLGAFIGPIAELAAIVTEGGAHLYHIAITYAIAGMFWLWTKFGLFLTMKSSRSHEYEADDFSYRLGYGNELCELLDSLESSSARDAGLFAALSSSHPDKNDRIAKLQESGAAYRKKYADDTL